MTLEKWNDLWNKEYKIKTEKTEFERFCKIFNMDVIAMHDDAYNLYYEPGYECIAEGTIEPYRNDLFIFYVHYTVEGCTIREFDYSTEEPISERIPIDEMINTKIKSLEEGGWKYTIPQRIRDDWNWE